MPVLTHSDLEHLRSQAFELAITRTLIQSLLSPGYIIEVDSGGDEPDLVSNAEGEILAAIFAVEMARLWVKQNPMTHENPKGIGWVQLVLGNGHEIISDYTLGAALSPLLTPAETLADRLGSANLWLPSEDQINAGLDGYFFGEDWEKTLSTGAQGPKCLAETRASMARALICAHYQI